MILEIPYIAMFNWIYKFTSKINIKIRYITIYFLFGLLTASILISHSMKFIGFVYPEIMKCFVGALILGLIIIFSIDKPLEKVEWNKILVYGIMACGLMLFITGFMHYIGYSYMMLGLIMTFEFPALFLVWNNRGDYDALYKIIARMVCLMAVIYFIICMLYAPIGADNTFAAGDRYAGTTSNPNTLGMLGAAFTATGIYSVFFEKRIYFIGAVTAGIGISLVLMSASRTGLLAIICMVIFSLIIIITEIFRHKKIEKTMLRRALICLILAGAIVIFAGKALEINAPEGNEKDPWQSQIYVEHVPVEDGESAISGRVKKGVNDSDADINTMSSGRLELWQAYLKKMNLFGNDVNNEKVYYEYGSSNELEYAHNTALEYAYRSGIIVGGIFLIFEIISGIWAVVMAFSARRRKPYMVFSIMAIICFGIISLLDVAVMPFSSLPLLLYWIGVIPIFVKKPFSCYNEAINESERV